MKHVKQKWFLFRVAMGRLGYVLRLQFLQSVWLCPVLKLNSVCFPWEPILLYVSQWRQLRDFGLSGNVVSCAGQKNWLVSLVSYYCYLLDSPGKRNLLGLQRWLIVVDISRCFSGKDGFQIYFCNLASYPRKLQMQVVLLWLVGLLVFT